MASSIEITLVGHQELLRKFRRIRGFFRSEELRTVLEDAKNRLVFIASRLAPKGESRLLSQIVGKVESFGTDDVKIKAHSPQRYAIYQEKGAKPHVIRPIERQAMFWVRYSTPKNRLTIKSPAGKSTEIGATFTFHRGVINHPGNPAQPFLGPAAEKVHPRLIQALHRIVNEALRRRA